MLNTYKLSYGDNSVLTYSGWNGYCDYTLPTGTYYEQLYFASNANVSAGTLAHSINDYDVIRVALSPGYSASNKAVGPNVYKYYPVEYFSNSSNSAHMRLFGPDNSTAVSSGSNIIWADTYLNFPTETTFVQNRNNAYSRVQSTWGTTALMATANTAIYSNYYKSVMEIDGIVYNGNRELLWSGNTGTSAFTLSKPITAFDKVQLQVNVNTGYDGWYILNLSTAIATGGRESITYPFGGTVNWYDMQVALKWADDRQHFSAVSAKALIKNSTTTAAMTGHTGFNDTQRKSITRVWGIKE